MKKGLSLLIASVFILSCSTSNEPTPVYDDILSNTKWTQDYIENSSTTIPDEHFTLPDWIKNRLEEEELSSETISDTILSIDYVKGKYTLIFSNDNKCTFENSSTPVGTYKIRTATCTSYHYPNQKHSFTDEHASMLYELIVENDTLTVKETYIGEGLYECVYEDTLYIGIINEFSILNISEAYPYLNSETEVFQMTYIRSGYNIKLQGDKDLVGVINDNCNEIYFEETGTLYIQI